MASVRTVPTATAPFVRAVDIVVGGLLLALALPAMAAFAVAVRLSSHGPVLHRERTSGKDGRAVNLLSFRTTLDGAGTEHHARLRGVVGASHSAAVTGVGRVLRATRADRLPRLLNVVRGESSLLAR